MCAGRICLVPAASDLAVGAMRDFSAMKRSNILIVTLYVHDVLTTCRTQDISFSLDCLTKCEIQKEIKR